ncbi:hypothetical protein EDF66_113135 [Sphingobacterium sp. JUb20]|nr:hypothetical protein [Sphingobacterium sp. JUb21]TCQ99910.1 hypothetical protein EDF66_113135 [Sphingobacterium sp. JUb20]
MDLSFINIGTTEIVSTPFFLQLELDFSNLLISSQF